MQNTYYLKNLIKRSFSEYLTWALQAIVLITLICILVPLSPKMPEGNLDSSWAIGINQALSQGLSFGRDIIFTFGPYASIYTTTYHPATDHLMLAGGLYLSISYGIAFILLTKDTREHLIFIFWLVLSGLIYSRDALLFSYPLIIALLYFKLFAFQNNIYNNNKVAIVLTIILFFPFGLLILIKGSILILCGLILVISITLLLIIRRWLLVLTVVVSSSISIIIFWIISGQSISYLPNYFISMAQIILGYTEAMSINGPQWQILCYLIASVLLLMTIILKKCIPIRLKIYLFSVFFVFLFLSFKGGFVRHDIHALISSQSLLIATRLFFLTLDSHLILGILLVYALSLNYINSKYFETSSESNLYQHIIVNYTSAWNGFTKRLARSNWLENDFNNSLRTLKEKAKFPLFQGTTDIFSYNQSYLIASGNIWNPRPILQSYSVYTSTLAETNKAFLLSTKAPDNILFKIEPIDGRIPSIEDGASWPALLSHYLPISFENNFLYLRKSLSKSNASNLLIGKGIHTFDETVVVKSVEKPVLMEILIRPTFLGRLANIFFKPTHLKISLNLENGTTKEFRITAGMVKSTFMISPLIENTAEFGLLYGRSNYLNNKGVKSFSITPVGGKSLWQKTYEVTFKEIDTLPAFDLSTFYKFDGIFEDTVRHHISTVKTCYGSIDFVNGASTTATEISIPGLIVIEGWLIKSVNQSDLPNTVLLVLTDKYGRTTFFNTRQTLRADVATYFNKPALDESGFTSTAEVSMLEGHYTLGLAFKEENQINLCSNFKIPVKLQKNTSHVQQ